VRQISFGLGYYALHDLQDKDRDGIQRPVLQLLQEAKDGKVEGSRQDEVMRGAVTGASHFVSFFLLQLPAVFCTTPETFNLTPEYNVCNIKSRCW
jgi:hypothetical protein